MKEAAARQPQIVLEVSAVVVFRLFETKKKISLGDTHEAPGGAILRTVPSDRMERRNWNWHIYATAFDTVLVKFAGEIALGLFVAWLYDKLKDVEPPIRKLKINRSEVEITPEGITRAIKESIEIEEK